MTRIILRCLVLLTGAVIALSFGFSYANVGNQATYLPHALNYFNPEFLANDWLVSKTTVYHGNFRWIVLVLSSLGSIGWAAAALNSLLIFLNLYLLYRLNIEIHRPSAIFAITLTILFVILDKTMSVGESYLFSDGLQPSAIATTAWICAIWCFFRRQYIISGGVLAIGGLFHANFLVLGIGLFTLTHLFIGKEKFLSRWATQVGPSIIVVIFYLPMLLAATGGDEARLAREIFLEIRAPHHYLPISYSTNFWYLSGWFACGLAAVYAMADLPRHVELKSFIMALGISITGATLLTTLVFIPQVSQLYVWRLAPFLQVLSQICVMIFLIRQLTERFKIGQHRIAILTAFTVGALGIIRWVVWSSSLSAQFVTVCVLIGIYLVLRLKQYDTATQRLSIIRAYCLTVLAVTLAVALIRIENGFHRSTLIQANNDSLITWVRHTPRNATFLIPPELGYFRLMGERGVVVDWKSTPIMPRELIAWYERLNAVSGRTVRSVEDAVDGYRKHDLRKLESLAVHFCASYIVVDNVRHHVKFEEALPVFSNDAYSVYRVQTIGAAVGCG